MLKIVLAGALLILATNLGVTQGYRLGGTYVLQSGDHQGVMRSTNPGPIRREISVLFVGNSFTFTADMPAMLANIASSDNGSDVRLNVKAITRGSATLDEMLKGHDALAFLQKTRPDYVVLQEQSDWYFFPDQAAYRGAAEWADAARPLNTQPVVFQIWADDQGAQSYTDQRYPSFGRSPDFEDTAIAQATTGLAGRLGAPMVKVGDAFQRARAAGDIPDLYDADHHHPGVGGGYLSALAFYRYFTGRTGAEATYRPLGMSAAEASKLVALSAG